MPSCDCQTFVNAVTCLIAMCYGLTQRRFSSHPFLRIVHCAIAIWVFHDTQLEASPVVHAIDEQPGMSRLLFPNLMFEEELEGRQSPMSSAAGRVVKELAPVMGLLSIPQNAATDIVVVSDDGCPAELPPALQSVRFHTEKTVAQNAARGMQFEPWGWSSSAIEFARRLGLHFESPSLEAVRKINSRQFLAPFDRFLAPGQTLTRTRRPEGLIEPDAGFWSPLESSGLSTLTEKLATSGSLCRSISEVQEALSQFQQAGFSQWVIKANYSQAARNRLLGKDLLSSSDVAWLQKRLQAEEPVYAEPWLERISECGLQFLVSCRKSAMESRSIQFLGAAELLTDTAGRYQGSVIRSEMPDEEIGWWAPAIDHGRAIAESAQQHGYFGPLGIDCMLVRESNGQRLLLRPCHDLNGRMTMGRVALSLRHFLRPGELGIWCHYTAASMNCPTNPFTVSEQNGVRRLPTSPGRVGDRSVRHQTGLLVSESRHALIQLMRSMFGTNFRIPIGLL
jgi:hypothetical protein